jgi:hypothetical protein
MLSRWKIGLACGVATFSASLPLLAQTVPNCEDVPEFANAVFGAGGSAVSPDLSQVAHAIAASSASGDDKFTVFYWAPSACTGYRAFKDGVSPATAQSFTYYVGTGSKPADWEKKCNGTSLPLTFSHMGSEVEFCNGETKPSDIGDFPAPIQTVNVITHKDNSVDTAISAEALHFIYGYGQNGQVAPWTEGAGVVQRDDTSFVHNYLAAAIKVPNTGFWWDVTPNYNPADHGGDADPKAGFAKNHVKSNGDTFKFIVDFVTGGGAPTQTLGYISGSQADFARDRVKSLAFRAFDQDCAVYPDKDQNSFDKLNVRLGRYALWAPGHFFAKVTDGQIVGDKAKKLIGWFGGTEPVPGDVDLKRAVIAAGDIPECAMQAYRDTAVGPIYSYAPRKPCGCFFETVASGAQPAACNACNADSECPESGQKCNFGYCEAYRAAGESEN